MPPAPVANYRFGQAPLMAQPNHEDINATWEYLKNGVNSIMVNLDGGMTMETVSLPQLLYAERLITCFNHSSCSLWLTCLFLILVHGNIHVSTPFLMAILCASATTEHILSQPALLWMGY